MTQTSALSKIRTLHPLLHCISNLVTAGDCANLALAIGASPIMAQEPQEMKEIASLAHAVVLNTGTPDDMKFAAAALAGQTANQRQIPVILDPVGIGASTWRLTSIQNLLKQVHPDILRVNLGEAKALLGQTGTEHGVDSFDTLQSADDCAMELARTFQTTVLLSGAEDLVTDGIRLKQISGGSPMTRAVTGAGCMLSVLCGAFASIQPDAPYTAACQASSFWKACAKAASTHAPGPASFRIALFDAAYQISSSRS